MKLRRKDALLIAFAVIVSVVAAGCGQRDTSPGATFKVFYEAALSRDVEGMKKRLSKSSLNYFEEMARAARVSTDEGLRANAEAIGQQMPETRNEKINGGEATLEFRNEKTGRWETVAFIKEDGAWKLAIARGR